ncbi:MAG: VanZ family protein [Lentisphaeraceae bacterium]|nr:VanZ family protein [Lentisphaeraceae bacterium]
MPVPSTGSPSQIDKVIHLSVFGLAGVLQILAYKRSKKGFILLLSYCLITECAQGLTGYRSFEWLDFVANFCGVLLSRVLLIKVPKSDEEVSVSS